MNAPAKALLLLACVRCIEAGAAERYAILEPKPITELERPCSRAGPGFVYGYWAALEQDAERAEKLLPGFVATVDRSVSPTSQSRRQYIGVIVDQKHFLYINFFPESYLDQLEYSREFSRREFPRRPLPTIDDWRTTFVAVCDGGPDYWSVLFEPETREFVTPRFNGR